MILSLQFAQPAWLFIGLLAAAGLVFAFVRFERSRQEALARFASSGLMDKLSASVSKRRRKMKRILTVAGTSLLFLALARPQIGYELQEVKRQGIDILFALDTSRSMLASDVSPDRLLRAKFGMVDFVQRLEGDRVGLLPFAGNAFLLCPLTLDYNAFQESLDIADTEIAPIKGTDLAAAIRTAEDAFKKAGNNHKILILITDGEDLEGDALDAAQEASSSDMTIHTIGVGTAAGEIITLGESGDFIKDASGNPVRSRLDEDMLQRIAEITGGIYAPLGQGAEGLDKIYNEKLQLVPKEVLKESMKKVPLERFQWPLFLAAACFFAEFILGTRRKRSLTGETVISAGRRHLSKSSTPVLVALSLGALGFHPPEVHADPRRDYNLGTKAYRNGEYEDAEKAFREALSSQDLNLQNRIYYNLGNTLYRAGEETLAEQKTEETTTHWENSLKAYDGALSLDPEDGDAQFNRDIIARKLEELKNQQQQEQKDQKGDKNQEDNKKEDQEENQDGEGDPQQGEGQDKKEGESGDKKNEEQKQQDGNQSQENPGEEGDKKSDKEEEKQDSQKTGEKNDQKEQGGDKKENGSPENKESPQPEQKPAPEGEIKSANPDQQEHTPEAKEAARKALKKMLDGKMTKDQAEKFLNDLRAVERRFIYIPPENKRDRQKLRKNQRDW